MVSLSRRQFFQTSIVGLTSVVAACSSSSSSSGELFSGPLLVALFSRSAVFASGVQQRVSFGLVDNGVPVVGDGDQLPVRIMKDNELVEELTVTGRVVAHEHTGDQADTEHEHASILRYYALRTVFPEAGVYDIEVSFGDTSASLPVQIFSPDEVTIRSVGDPFPLIDTPTIGNEMNVDPLCSRLPACDLHQVSAGDVIGSRPTAVLIATPAFCATQYCGPVLDVVLEEMADFGHIQFIHVEVFENPREVDGNYNDPRIKPAATLAALDLEFEPSLYLVGADGIIVDRIDNVFDAEELRQALAAL